MPIAIYQVRTHAKHTRAPTLALRGHVKDEHVRDEHVKDAAQDVEEDVVQEMAEDVLRRT